MLEIKKKRFGLKLVLQSKQDENSEREGKCTSSKSLLSKQQRASLLSGCFQKQSTVLRLWASILRLQVHTFYQPSSILGSGLIIFSEIWSKDRQYKRAGELFERAGVSYIPQAAEEYYKAKLPTVALNLLLRGKYYVKAVHGLTL